MLHRSCCRLAKPVTGEVNPYGILGLDPSVPFEVVRQRFHALTQKYHPDMPDGDPVKFRKINAAYRQLRAEYRNASTCGARTGDGMWHTHRYAPSSEEFWTERNQHMRDAWERNQTAKRREAQKMRDSTRREHPSFAQNVFAVLNGYELVISLATVVVAGVCAVERYWTVRKLLEARDRHLHNINEVLPPPMPMELDPKLVDRYREVPARTERESDAARIREECSYRRATQRRFDDFREFMYVHDPEGISVRQVRISRFSHQYVKDSDIPKRCPIVRTFNSDVKGQGFETIEKELVHAIQSTPGARPDEGFAGALIARGLASVPASSPSTAKWTFIEYQEVDKHKGQTEPTCMVALRNERFGQVGMCQRVSITGNSSLQPQLRITREEELRSGVLQRKHLKQGGVLPVTDTSVPLREMKL